MSSDFIDTFSDARPPGKVVGTNGQPGVVRSGVDVEGVIGIDDGALRIQPLVHPDWGRAALIYGPYSRKPGLAFAVSILNGHNTSQIGGLDESLIRRLHRWLRGSDIDKPSLRLLRFVRSPQKKTFPRQLHRWIAASLLHRGPAQPSGDENLALGWFPSKTPMDPAAAGSAFIMHATGAENGELWLRSANNNLRALRGVQNIPICYLVILRQEGAAYYAASLPGAPGFCAFPELRPLGIDPFSDEKTLYAGMHPRVQGQIGFRVDTRVYGVQVSHLTEYEAWYGTAHAADRLEGGTALQDAPAEVGGDWRVLQGGFERTSCGLRSMSQDNQAVMDPGIPSGLIHILASAGGGDGNGLELFWRMRDEHNYWRLYIDELGCRLDLNCAGVATEIAHSQTRLRPGIIHALQISDDGQVIGIYLDGNLLFENWFQNDGLADASGLGIGMPTAGGVTVSAFEAHPRRILLPKALRLSLPELQKGSREIIQEDFVGPAGELAGSNTLPDGRSWRKELGDGSFELTGENAVRVSASAKEPNPGRTAYTLAWDEPSFADLEVQITPPGTERGQWEKGRGGLIFWQDSRNYIIINTWLDDTYQGASISSFFYLNGFEDIYDAVWTNVGRRVLWGVPYTLQVSFDGLVYCVFLNHEPVLYRSLADVYPGISPLAVNRVGIAANWEWGNDTGSYFRQFIGRAR